MANITVDIKKKSIDIGSNLVAIGKGGMSPGVYDPQEIKADVFDMDNMVDGIDKHYLTTEQIEEFENKQDALTAGENIDITNNVISATDTTYTAGEGISIDENNVISNTRVSAEWGNIEGNIEDQTDLQDALADKQDIISDLSEIRSNATAGKNASDTIATYGDIVTHDADEFATADSVGEGVLTIQKNSTTVDTFSANATENKTINITVPTQASDIGALPDTTKYAANLDLSINSSTYVITAQLKDQDGNNIGNQRTIDLPLESVVVSGSYDSATKEVVLTLEGGNTIRFSVADLVSGLQTEITSTNKLDADLVDDSTSTNKFVTAADLTKLSNTSGVNTGDQSASDFDINDLSDSCGCRQTWDAKQNALTAGSNIDITGDTISATDTIPNNAKLTIQKNGTKIDDFTADASEDKTINITVPVTAADVCALPDTTKYGSSVEMSINSSTYVVTLTLKDQNGDTLGTAQTIDLPIESVVVSGSYDSETKEVVLVLESGSEIRFSVADLVSGLQTEITVDNKLSSDLVDDTNHTHKFVTATDICNWNAKADICDIPTDNCQLANGCGYTTCTGTLVPNDLAPYAKCCDIPTDNCQLANSCGYTTCTGTLVQSDIQNLAQCCDIPTDNCQLGNGCGYITCDDLPDLSGYQLKCNMVCDLTNADNDHYPTAKAVSDAMACAGVGDMLKSVYDPCGCEADAFNACNMYNMPHIPTDNCELSNSCGYTTCTGTLVQSDIQNLAQCCDIPSACDFDINDLGDACSCKDTWNCKQDALTAGNNITINGTTISGDFNYAEPTTPAACATKCVCIPEITQLCPGQTIIVKPTITATNCATNLKLNDFDAYPVRYNNAALTTSTDGYVRGANQLTQFLFDGSYWHVVSKSYDANATYTMNYSVDAGKYTAGVGKYAISRYSLVLQKDDGTWETVKETSTNYSTATTKTVNTNGFVLGKIRYYGTTTVYANGALIATNVLYNKAASVDMRYSTNCGGTTDWAEGDFIYLVGTIGVNGLFYLDTTKRWSNTLPNTKDNKVYIRLGIALAAEGYTMSLLDDRPIFYYDNGIKIYQQADNKQDVISDLTTIRSGAELGATAIQPNDNISELTNDVGYITSAPVTSVNNQTGDVVLTIPTTASDVGALPNTTKYGAVLTLEVNSSTYVVTATLKDQDGNTLGTAQTIDLPLESVVVSGSYNDTTKKIILTLQSGSTVEFSVADLVAGLQSEITSTNKLSSDLVDDTNHTNKFVTAAEKTKLSNLSGTNTGDETGTTIKTKLGAASASQDGYLTSTDWSTFNSKQNAISDLATIRSGAEAGATALQPGDLACYAQCCDIPDTSCLAQCCDIPTDNCQLSNGCCYLTESDLACLTGDVCNSYSSEGFTNVAGLSTGCLFARECSSFGWQSFSMRPGVLSYQSCFDGCYRNWEYTFDKSCTGMAQMCDLPNTSCLAQCCDIPTDNCQLTNGCGYTTCTGTLSTCSDVIGALGYTPYNSTNPNGYTTCTGTLTSGDLKTINGDSIVGSGDIEIGGGAISGWNSYDYSSSHPASITLNSDYYNHSITINANGSTVTSVSYGSGYTPTPGAQYSFDIINPSTNDLIITILGTQLVVFGDDEGYVHNIFNFIYDDTAGMYRVIAGTENLLTQTQYDSLNAGARTDGVLRWIVEK